MNTRRLAPWGAATGTALLLAACNSGSGPAQPATENGAGSPARVLSNPAAPAVDAADAAAATSAPVPATAGTRQEAGAAPERAENAPTPMQPARPQPAQQQQTTPSCGPPRALCPPG